MMYYTMTTIFDGEVYNHMVQTDSRDDALEALAKHVHTEYWREFDELDMETEPLSGYTDYKGWVVSMVVTKDKPLSYGGL